MNLNLHIDQHIATLTFDREGSQANLFDRETLLELDRMLDKVEADNSLTGLLIDSAKPTIFIAGADLDTLSQAEPKALRELIALGQRVFNRIADLKLPSVAAIHGACVGGGLELALACDWRAASAASCTRIGLPETQLGILPAWGGSTRLPQLIGLPTALPLVLGGKLLKPKAALRKGVVDAVVAREHLIDHARGLIKRGKRKPRGFSLLHNPLAACLIGHKASRDLHAKTRGLYPGPQEALKVMVKSIGSSRAESLQRECDAIERLSTRPETKQLLRLFFLREKARKPSSKDASKIGQAAVIGSGVMGSGIAYWLSTRKHRVILRDVSDEALAKGMQSIRKLYHTASKRRVMDVVEAKRGMDRIQPSAAAVPLTRCDLVIEAASENLEIKKKIFAELSEFSTENCLLATNTSALPIHELSASIRNPQRLLGLHFFNPVHRMPLVEVVRTPDTSEQAIATAMAFVADLGKIPILVRDSPGFLVNRILMPYLVEAAEMFSRGGDPKEIDDAMLDFGMPMGPLRLLDEVGLDVTLHVAQTLADAYPDRMHVPKIAEQLVERGLLGRKSGEGFYLHDKQTTPSPVAMTLRGGNAVQNSNIQGHLAKLMSDEAKRCLDDGIAESAGDIDLAMILGTGYAPFRGGPLTHSNSEQTQT